MSRSSGTTRREFLGRAAALGSVALASAVVSPRATPGIAAQDSGGWQIGIYTRPWAKFEYPVALDAIAEAGYEFLGLMTIKAKNNVVISADSSPDEAHRAGEEARKRGLTIVSVYGGTFPADRKSLLPGIRGLQRLIDNTAACGCGSLLLGGIGRAEQEDAYYKIIRECCDYAAEKKVLITLKPHGPLNATGPECRARCEKVGNKQFRIWYDPGNILYYSDGKLDPVQDAASVDGLVCGMSVKDYAEPKRVDVTPGTGKVNFPAVMARLRQGGFTSGPLVIECLSPGDLPALVAEARKAKKFVEDLVRN